MGLAKTSHAVFATPLARVASAAGQRATTSAHRKFKSPCRWDVLLADRSGRLEKARLGAPLAETSSSFTENHGHRVDTIASPRLLSAINTPRPDTGLAPLAASTADQG